MDQGHSAAALPAPLDSPLPSRQLHRRRSPPHPRSSPSSLSRTHPRPPQRRQRRTRWSPAGIEGDAGQATRGTNCGLELLLPSAASPVPLLHRWCPASPSSCRRPMRSRAPAAAPCFPELLPPSPASPSCVRRDRAGWIEMEASVPCGDLIMFQRWRRELAYQYAEKGAYLALVARRKHALEAVAEAARERGAPDVIVLLADVSDAEESRRAVEETVSHFGKLNHLVANAGIWATGCFDEVTNITAFTKMMDVNFWGSVYPTYYALPHLKASRGKLVVCSSAAGTVATSRMSFYNATKAAQLRFYETLRSEFGSDVGVTILTPGYVESEITQGKGIQKNGEFAVNEEMRDAQVGVFPVGRVETLCEIALDSIRKGDPYVTWPSLYRPLELIACLAPEVLNWVSYTQYNTRNGGRSLGQRIVEATGARRLYPSALRRPLIMKTEKCDEEDAALNV